MERALLSVLNSRFPVCTGKWRFLTFGRALNLNLQPLDILLYPVLTFEG